ncbi:MAG: glycosyltransferase family 2 protein [Ruminococcaceae bacterium]|nr:glycosyltransferase family 2 protein [Oscillospiraceae bacterium]
MPTFSLIVPIYKIEQYLPKCIESVLAQKCRDFELLLIDDGSPDGSGKLIDDYATRHPALIRAIHQPNGGAGAARNHGIALAKGEYLLFVDGDDYLDDTLLSDLATEIEKTHADLYLFGAHVEKDGVKNGELHELVEVRKPCNAASTPELFFGIMAPWNRAYKKSLFENIEFASRVWYEDIRVVTKVNAMAKTVIRLPQPYYHYLQREGSAMNNKNSERNVEILYAFDDILSWFREQKLYDTYRNELTFLAIEHLLIAATVRVLQIDRKHHLVNDFRQYMEKKFPDFRENKHLPLLDKNKRLIYKLLLKKRYRTVNAIFRIKKLLGK